MIGFIIAYWVFFSILFLLIDDEPTYVGSRIRPNDEQRVGDEGDGFAWAFHGLTKD